MKKLRVIGVFMLCLFFVCMIIISTSYFLFSSRAAPFYLTPSDYGYINLPSKFDYLSNDVSDLDDVLSDLGLDDSYKKEGDGVLIFKELVGEGDGFEVVLSVSHQGSGAIVVREKRSDSGSCFVLPFSKGEEGTTFPYGVVVGPAAIYAGYMVGFCRLKYDPVPLKRVSFIDFVFFDVFDCFGQCKKNKGMKYINEIRESQRVKMLEAFDLYHSKWKALSGGGDDTLDLETIVFKNFIGIRGLFFVDVEFDAGISGDYVLSLAGAYEGGRIVFRELLTSEQVARSYVVY